MLPKAPKASITCNWMRSNVTNETLADFVKSGYLPKKDVMSYRAPRPLRGKTTAKRRGGGSFCGSYEPGLRTARFKVFQRRSEFLRSAASGHRTQLNVQYLQLPSVLRGLPWRRTQSAALQRAFLFKPPERVCQRAEFGARQHLHPAAQGLPFSLRRAAKPPQRLESDVVLLPRHVAG